MLASLIMTGSPTAHAAESPLQSIQDFLGTKKTVIYNQITEDISPSDKKSQENITPTDKKKIPKEITDPKEIERAAEFAAKATGVRKDFLMGMLEVESDLGRKTGACTYKEVEDGAENSHNNGMLGDRAYNTFLNRRETIKDLAKDLGYDYEQLKVSCNPAGYVGTGGALGVPQFMPDIWMDYKDQISEIVGKENPDPWNAEDGVVAMALLLKDTPGVTDHNYYAERNAAKMYLSGTTSYIYDWYADQAFYWAQNYQKLLG